MSIRSVVVEWLEWGLEPGQLDTLTPEEQRHFVADICQAEPEWTFDAFSEGFSRSPAKRVELEQALRDGDFLQLGAVLDSVIRNYIIETCSEFWEAEFTVVKEQENRYDGE